MLLEQVGKGLIRQFLKGRHPIARELRQFVRGVVVEGDQFTHALPAAAISRVLPSLSAIIRLAKACCIARIRVPVAWT